MTGYSNVHCPKLGDNLFSYRFSEVMSVGSIPVIYADDWMLPFGKHLINWTETSVVIPESEVLNSSHILTQINMEQRCRMRQNVLRIFREYMETGRGVIKGIVESLEIEFSSKE
jgi:Exostosin family